MTVYRIVRRLLEEHYVEADTPQQAKDKIVGRTGTVYDSEIVAVEVEEPVVNTKDVVITEIHMKPIIYRPTEE